MVIAIINANVAILLIMLQEYRYSQKSLHRLFVFLETRVRESINLVVDREKIKEAFVLLYTMVLKALWYGAATATAGTATTTARTARTC